MTRYDIAAGDDQFGAAIRFDPGGRRVGVGRFTHRSSRPLDAPQRLAAGLVNLQQVRRIVRFHAVQHLHVERVAAEQRRRGVAPVETELAVLGLQVARPDFLAGEIKRLEDAEPGHDPHVLAIGHRRRRRHVLLALHVIGVGELPLPADGLLVAIDRPQLEHAGVGGGGDIQEDRVAPDDRGRPAIGRQRQLPRHVLGFDVGAHGGNNRAAFEITAAGPLPALCGIHSVFGRRSTDDRQPQEGVASTIGAGCAPGRGQRRFGADAVVRRATPVGPVLRQPGSAGRSQQHNDQTKDVSHTTSPQIHSRII